MSLARKRLLRDFKNLQKDPPHGVSGAPMNNDIMKWKAVVFGPDGTIWEGGTFTLQLEFSEDYPNRAPKVLFLSRVFHPNVYADGRICLDILQNQWSPVYDISAILTSIRSLLSDPNPASPANNEAAQLYVENRREYNNCVAACVSDSWRSIDNTLPSVIDCSSQQNSTSSSSSSSSSMNNNNINNINNNNNNNNNNSNNNRDST